MDDTRLAPRERRRRIGAASTGGAASAPLLRGRTGLPWAALFNRACSGELGACPERVRRLERVVPRANFADRETSMAVRIRVERSAKSDAMLRAQQAPGFPDRLLGLVQSPALHGALLSLALSIVPDPSAADDAKPPYLNESVIRDDVLQGARGAISVNQASGSENAQANAASIAVGDTVASLVTIRQHTESNATPTSTNRVLIKKGAFNGAQGHITVNQSAGNANAQSNAIAVATGIEGEALHDSTLAGVQIDQSARTTTDESNPLAIEAAIKDGAFAGTSGVVQINQAAGNGNATSNVFVLRTDAR